MHAILATVAYKYESFFITDREDIWRIWLDGNRPMMQRLAGNEPEYASVIRLLRARKGLYE